MPSTHPTTDHPTSRSTAGRSAASAAAAAVSTRPSLLAVSRVPPWLPTHGATLRIRGLLEGLATRWDVTLVFARNSDHEGGTVTSPVYAVEEVALGASEHEANVRSLAPLGAAVRRVVAAHDFDVALLWSGTEFLLREPWFTLPAVCDKIDSETLAAWRRQRLARTPAAWLHEVRSLLSWARYERRAARAATAMVVVGEDDARAIDRISGRHAHVIPNGVRVDDPIAGDAAAAAVAAGAQSATPMVVFTGNLDFPPNVAAAEHFAHESWPAVRAAVPSARFVIAGRHPAPAVRALAALPGVEVAADVADMRALLREAWVAVAPMRSGGGVKNKVLEAWASGRPVVMTSLATNGLRVDAGEGGVVADDAGEMAREVVAFLEDGERRQRAGEAARRAVAERHSWPALAGELSAVLEQAAAATPRRPRAARASG